MRIKKTMLYEPSKRAENVAKCSPCLHTVCPKKGYSSTSLYATEDPSFSRVLRACLHGGRVTLAEGLP